ncbi:unnamed protein product [Cuscuta epithymum]|uniref:Retrotransposon Copia-like N-terminal domain-containing protein n=1 Tax=Cuscuta epithymum TaxID=186058 RepID=A0AAV0FQJ9_9ASTE|nr:unnamed protein product [Cuscuta epithymum]
MTLDITSPYYLGSGDQPGNLITHMIFKGDNYVAWSRAILLSLKARRKNVFVDGTLKRLEAADQQSNWDTANSMVVSWMLRSMEPSIVNSVPFHDDARSLWVYLEKRFSVANGLRLQQLKASISACKQTKNMSVDNYYTLLMGLYDELYRLKPLPVFTCSNCTCNIVGKIEAERAEERLHQFLVGIDDELYGTVRSNLLSQDPLPNVDRAYQAFVQEETSRAAIREKNIAADVHAFALPMDCSAKGRVEKSDSPRPTSSHCKQKGHEVGSCFKLHGYLDWWEDRNRHKSTPTGRGGGVSMNAVAATLLPAPETASSSSVGSNTGSVVLTTEQVQALLNLLNTDTRSSDRMSGPVLEEPDWSR